jgi:hypothetical protein
MRSLLLVGLLAACGSVSNKPDASPSHDAPSIDARADAGPDAPTCAAKPSSLAGRWRADMNTNDSVGTYNGTTVGNVAYTNGKYGNAFLLDGASEYITINDNDTLWPTGSFSISAWVNTTHSGSIVQKYECWNSCPPGVTNAFWGLAVNNGSAEVLVRPDASTAFSSITDSLHTINDGQWHQIVGVRDSTASTLILYVDGASVVTANLDSVHNGPLTNNDTRSIRSRSAPTPRAARRPTSRTTTAQSTRSPTTPTRSLRPRSPRSTTPRRASAPKSG